MSELTYTRSGDYLIPDLSLTEQPQAPLGKYGRMRKDYLKEHRPVLWNSLLLSEKLYPHLREIDEAANNRLEQMMPELMKSAGVTESLKASDPMKWVGLMNPLKAQAEETILTELLLDVYKRQGQGRKAVHGVLQSAGRRRHDRRVQGIHCQTGQEGGTPLGAGKVTGEKILFRTRMKFSDLECAKR